MLRRGRRIAVAVGDGHPDRDVRALLGVGVAAGDVERCRRVLGGRDRPDVAAVAPVDRRGEVGVGPRRVAVGERGDRRRAERRALDRRTAMAAPGSISGGVGDARPCAVARRSCEPPRRRVIVTVDRDTSPSSA